MYHVIAFLDGKSIEDCYTFFSNYSGTAKEYISFLIDKELGIVGEQDEVARYKSKFRHIETPFIIENMIIDIEGIDGVTNLKHLEHVEANFIQVRIFYDIDKKGLIDLSRALDTLNCWGVELLISYNSIDTRMSRRLFFGNQKIKKIFVYGSPQYTLEQNKDIDKVYYMQKSITSEKHCGCIKPELFSLSYFHIQESQNRNTCLNKKISIDKNGYVKNCPAFRFHYGHVKDLDIVDVVKSKKFQKMWNISKEAINGCKTCEFRNVCTDCRAFIEDPDDIYSKPLKCGYNPETCEWEDWSTNPLKQKAIEFYGLKDKDGKVI